MEREISVSERIKALETAVNAHFGKVETGASSRLAREIERSKIALYIPLFHQVEDEDVKAVDELAAGHGLRVQYWTVYPGDQFHANLRVVFEELQA
jgi:hypothetical protein